MIAALFVAENGCYANLPGVEVWHEWRDARCYEGPHPIVAHPPCQRWGRFWSADGRYGIPGMDEGCFDAALTALIRYGGVIEHPQDSLAWSEFCLPKPPRCGGWVETQHSCTWTCRVEQGHYGHRARKATWLLYKGDIPPSDLVWGPSEPKIKPRPGRDPIRERRIGAVQRMCKREREATPIPFRDLLISLARNSRQARAA